MGKNKRAGFVHLHVHSEHSPLDSTARVEDIVEAAVADDAPAVAITDHGTLSGTFALYRAAKDAGIKPILGIEAYVAIGSRHEQNTVEVPSEEVDTDPGESEGKVKIKKYHHITILASTETGWRNLVAMHNASQESTWGGKARIDYDLLAEHAQGLLVLTGCLGGPVMGPASRGDTDGARAGLEALIGAVGAQNVYVEVMDHGIEVEQAALPLVRELAAEYDLPLLATNDVHHIAAEGSQAHEAWLTKQTGTTLSDPNRFRLHGAGYHMRTSKQMRAVRDEQWWTEACENTLRLAERVTDDVLPAYRQRLPKFPVPAGHADTWSYFIDLLRQGARERYGDPLPKQVRERLNYETRVIKGFGVWDYFLIKHELTTWARSQGIFIGPGRGSAPGALTSYVLGITGIDPLRHGLLFERFLDPSRVGMPDIDTDFEERRLNEVRAHLAQQYGSQYVARLGTFQVTKSKNAVKSAARALGHPASLGEDLAKLIPDHQASPASFEAMRRGKDVDASAFWDFVSADDRAQDVVELAGHFEDVVSNRSAHACGMVVSDEPLTDLVPMRKDTSEGINAQTAPLVSEWDAEGIEDGAGLLKLDALGIRNLDIVSRTLEAVERLSGERIDPYTDIPDPDDGDDERVARTWKMLAQGRTAAVFQLDSAGMTALTQDVAPTRWEHMTALVALYRPGPMAADMHTVYARRKNGHEDVDYAIFTSEAAEQKVLARVLDRSFGVVAYQEQMMQLGAAVAGFGPAETNRLRKAISKKVTSELVAVGELFLAGAVADRDWEDKPKVAFSPKSAERVWDTIRGAGEYAFNASHAAAYGYLAYLTAYLKANYPAAYLASALAQTTKDPDRRTTLIRALYTEGIKVLPPDVNASQYETAAADETSVFFGLGEIKDVGQAAQAIIAEREYAGEFTSLQDMFDRVKVPSGQGQTGALSVTILRALVEAGACDGFGPRKGLMRIVHTLRGKNPPAAPEEEWGLAGRAGRQQARLGFSVGKHPMAALTSQLRAWEPPVYGPDRNRIGNAVVSLHKALAGGEGMPYTIGLVTGWKVKAGRRGQMAIAQLEGSRCRTEAVAYSATVRGLAHDGVDVKAGMIVGIQARVRSREVETTNEAGEVTHSEVRSLVINKLWPIDFADTDEREAKVAEVIDLRAFAYSHGCALEPAGQPAQHRPAPAAAQPSLKPVRTKGSLSLLEGGKAQAPPQVLVIDAGALVRIEAARAGLPTSGHMDALPSVAEQDLPEPTLLRVKVGEGFVKVLARCEKGTGEASTAEELLSAGGEWIDVDSGGWQQWQPQVSDAARAA